MQTKTTKINNLPIVTWGEPSEKLIIAVHGSMSNKTDTPIQLLAEKAIENGYQVLSFDLPEHGDRKEEATLCKVEECIKDLKTIIEYAKEYWSSISLFANSIGAYFSLMAYSNEKIEKALFLSPLVDMQRMIENIMMWFQITKKQLEEEQTIPTPIGQILYWDYYCYVLEHPVEKWAIPTHILYGDKDDTCEKDTIDKFVRQFHANLDIVKEGEHYFHTPVQLSIFSEWLNKVL